MLISTVICVCVTEISRLSKGNMEVSSNVSSVSSAPDVSGSTGLVAVVSVLYYLYQVECHDVCQVESAECQVECPDVLNGNGGARCLYTHAVDALEIWPKCGNWPILVSQLKGCTTLLHQLQENTNLEFWIYLIHSVTLETIKNHKNWLIGKTCSNMYQLDTVKVLNIIIGTLEGLEVVDDGSTWQDDEDDFYDEALEVPSSRMVQLLLGGMRLMMDGWLGGWSGRVGAGDFSGGNGRLVVALPSSYMSTIFSKLLNTTHIISLKHPLRKQPIAQMPPKATYYTHFNHQTLNKIRTCSSYG